MLNCISWNIYIKTAIPSKLPKGSVDLGDMWKFVFDQVPFRLFHDEYKDIESSFKQVWNTNPGQRLGDGDCKNEIYALLKEMDRQPFIPPFVIDGVVDSLLNYQESIGQYGDDYSVN